MKLSSKLGLAVWASLLSAAAYSQQSVKWDAARAALAGQGCVKDVDAFVLENGNDLSVVFSNLGVNLPGNSSSTLAARSNCTVRVPARVAPGVYIGELTQRISYGVTKTARTRGSVATRSTFFGFPVSPYTIDLPYGRSINEPLLVNSRQDLFSVRTTPTWYQGWCAPRRAPQGLYQANFAISGQKDHASEDLIMFVDGLDLKWEIVAGPVQCQL
ncbi:MAG: hypothetical protein NT027_13760 [Proteobacteria bacterium]|nr:hypothetical protein [Pseudomonadota bacterium]